MRQTHAREAEHSGLISAWIASCCHSTDTRRAAPGTVGEAAGTLNSGQARALVARLNAAIQQIAQGNSTAAIAQLAAFTNQVMAYVNAGVLSPAEAQALIDAVGDIVTQLGG